MATTKQFELTAVSLALIRFVRVIVPQVPAILAYLTGIKPEWAAGLSLVGAVVTALDKYAREKGWY